MSLEFGRAGKATLRIRDNVKHYGLAIKLYKSQVQRPNRNVFKHQIVYKPLTLPLVSLKPLGLLGKD